MGGYGFEYVMSWSPCEGFCEFCAGDRQSLRRGDFCVFANIALREVKLKSEDVADRVKDMTRGQSAVF